MNNIMLTSSYFFFVIFIGTIILLADALLVGAEITTAQSTALQQRFSFFEKLLNTSVVRMSSLINAPAPASSSACAADVKVACTATSPPQIPIVNFTPYIPAEYAYLQIKGVPGVHPSPLTSHMADVCAMNAMKPTWIDTFNVSSGDTRYQYYVTEDDLAGFFPANSWNQATTCQTYRPTERPFYVSGATGMKDVVVLIDASTRDADAAARFDMAKKIATHLAKSLSFKDFITVAPYTELVDVASASPTLTQATAANVVQIVQQISDMTLDTSSNKGTNIGAALEFAFETLKRSREVGDTSNCTQTVVLLSGGSNDGASPIPDDVVSKNSKVVLFNFLVTTNATQARRNRVGGIACNTQSGIFREITSHAEIANWEVYNKFFAALAPAGFVARFSEFYEDIGGQGSILSASGAVYRTLASGIKELAGVLTIDTPLAGFIAAAASAGGGGGVVTGSDVNAFNEDQQVCTPLAQDQPWQKPAVDAMRNDTCKGIGAVPIEEIQFWRKSAGIIVGSIVGLVLLPSVLLWLGLLLDGGNSFRRNKQIYIVSLPVYYVSWIIAAPIGFAMVMPDIVERDHFIPQKFVIDRVDENPYRCCQKRCQYSCQDFFGPSCSSMLASKTEGDCGDGRYCCRWYHYDCNCRDVSYKCRCTTTKKCRTSSSGKRTCTSSRKCSTCYKEVCDTCRRCVHRISNHRCSVFCGTCWNLVAVTRYDYKGVILRSAFSKHCGLDDFGCKDGFLAQFVVGSVKHGFVNPENPRDIRTDVDVRAPAFGAMMFFAVITAICALIQLGVAVLGALPECFSETVGVCKSSSSSSSSSGRGRSSSSSSRPDEADSMSVLLKPKPEPVLVVPTMTSNNPYDDPSYVDPADMMTAPASFPTPSSTSTSTVPTTNNFSTGYPSAAVVDPTPVVVNPMAAVSSPKGPPARPVSAKKSAAPAARPYAFGLLDKKAKKQASGTFSSQQPSTNDFKPSTSFETVEVIHEPDEEPSGVVHYDDDDDRGGFGGGYERYDNNDDFDF